MAAILHVKSVVLGTIHRFMRSRDIIQITPVILSSITDPLGPDPDADLGKHPTIQYTGQKLVLCQSMIFHKQLSLLTDVKGIYAISPNIRLEKPRKRKTGKHLFEFCQADFEIARAGMEDVMSFVENLFIQIFEEVKEQCEAELTSLDRSIPVPKRPFPRFTSHEVKAEYGEEWEDQLSNAMQEPVWVTCHDREFYDKEEKERPGHFKNYDLIYPEGYGEALSGGEREYRHQRIIERLREDGIPLNRYDRLLKAAKKGLLSSAGAGFGIERLTRFLTGSKHIREVTLFPKVPGEQVCF